MNEKSLRADDEVTLRLTISGLYPAVRGDYSTIDKIATDTECAETDLAQYDSGRVALEDMVQWLDGTSGVFVNVEVARYRDTSPAGPCRIEALETEVAGPRLLLDPSNAAAVEAVANALGREYGVGFAMSGEKEMWLADARSILTHLAEVYPAPNTEEAS